ncbi:hypothetical protein CANARDRAFT_148774 [[Candida] arabinofermentans NRRL YB-2248]|uniref:BRCT domain-containing protein n=1 Tax=[Candida] arabinofermentans NRRL YB-2248 TaxID=983967 RepID=A0A1E4T2N2_9ASCO|nr:hypothetical protein CANARDRAFT_148774 [[Candida] arabinofermentans NRRL YB-2248]
MNDSTQKISTPRIPDMKSSSSSSSVSMPEQLYDDTLARKPPSITIRNYEKKKLETKDNDTISVSRLNSNSRPKRKYHFVPPDEDSINTYPDSSSHRVIEPTEIDDLRINDTQTPLLNKIVNPFEETPTSAAHSPSKATFNVSTPLPSRSKSKTFDSNSNHHTVSLPNTNTRGISTAADIFKNLRNNEVEAFEYDTENGIVLDEHDNISGDDSGIPINLHGDTKIPFGSNFFQNNTEDSTQVDGNINEEVNRMLEEKERQRNSHKNSFSYHHDLLGGSYPGFESPPLKNSLNFPDTQITQQIKTQIIDVRTQTQESDKKDNLGEDGEDDDDVQVPGTIDTSRHIELPTYSPLHDKNDNPERSFLSVRKALKSQVPDQLKSTEELPSDDDTKIVIVTQEPVIASRKKSEEQATEENDSQDDDEIVSSQSSVSSKPTQQVDKDIVFPSTEPINTTNEGISTGSPKVMDRIILGTPDQIEIGDTTTNITNTLKKQQTQNTELRSTIEASSPELDDGVASEEISDFEDNNNKQETLKIYDGGSQIHNTLPETFKIQESEDTQKILDDEMIVTGARKRKIVSSYQSQDDTTTPVRKKHAIVCNDDDDDDDENKANESLDLDLDDDIVGITDSPLFSQVVHSAEIQLKLNRQQDLPIACSPLKNKVVAGKSVEMHEQDDDLMILSDRSRESTPYASDNEMDGGADGNQSVFMYDSQPIEQKAKKEGLSNTKSVNKNGSEIFRGEDAITMADFKHSRCVFVRDSRNYMIPVQITGVFKDKSSGLYTVEVIDGTGLKDIVPFKKIVSPSYFEIGSLISCQLKGKNKSKSLNSKKKTSQFQVTGLEYDKKLKNQLTCMRGYNKLYLKKYIGKDIVDSMESEFSVPVTDTYLTSVQGRKFKFRPFDDADYFNEYLEQIYKETADEDVTSQVVVDDTTIAEVNNTSMAVVDYSMMQENDQYRKHPEPFIVDRTVELCVSDINFKEMVLIYDSKMRCTVPVMVIDVYEHKNNGYKVVVINGDGVEIIIDSLKIVMPCCFGVGDLIKIVGVQDSVEIIGMEYDPDFTSSKLTCMRGYNKVHALKSNGDVTSVSLDSIYLTREFDKKAEWKRVFGKKENLAKFLKSFQKEKNDDDVAVDVSQILPVSKGEESRQLPFESCVFVITSLSSNRSSLITEETLKIIEKFITKNGGCVINDSLENWIQKSSNLEKFKFAALLSPTHIRTLKYLQFVTLSWPILSIKFILDLIEMEKLGGGVSHDWKELWMSYMLPSGESTYMKCTLSLNLFKFYNNWKMGLSLDQQIGINHKIFKNCQFLIHDDFEKRNSSVSLDEVEFFIDLLGCKDIRLIDEISNDEIEDVSDLDIIYLYSPDQKLDLNGFENCLISGGASTTSIPNNKKKRKVMNNLLRHGLEVRVVNWEWLVQCIIANRLFEPSFKYP